MAGTTLKLRHAEQVDAAGRIIISNDLGSQTDRTTFILGPQAGCEQHARIFAPFYTENDRFTKTGSGHT
jgi:hypothetical protein